MEYIQIYWQTMVDMTAEDTANEILATVDTSWSTLFRTGTQ